MVRVFTVFVGLLRRVRWSLIRNYELRFCKMTEETSLLDLQMPGPSQGSLLNAEYVEVSCHFLFTLLLKVRFHDDGWR